MENREKFEIPTIAFTAVTMLTTPSSTCASPSPCPDFRPSETQQGILVIQNETDSPGCDIVVS